MDAYSRYRCWVYQRSDLNRVLMSMSVGTFCHGKQRVDSWNSSEGAQVSLDMIEYERERKFIYHINFFMMNVLCTSMMDQTCIQRKKTVPLFYKVTRIALDFQLVGDTFLFGNDELCLIKSNV
uniref:Uncharacterized protein n=1 Tax=Tetranychus urticae TaxID=32264 RepID=A0A158P558_TETUR